MKNQGKYPDQFLYLFEIFSVALLATYGLWWYFLRLKWFFSLTIPFTVFLETKLYNIQPRYSIICNIKEKPLWAWSYTPCIVSKKLVPIFQIFLKIEIHVSELPLKFEEARTRNEGLIWGFYKKGKHNPVILFYKVIKHFYNLLDKCISTWCI
jgi:hypothetical protein